MSLNEETVLMMHDRTACATVDAQFMEDLEFAKEITLEEFKKRGRLERVKESVCYAFWRIL